MNFYLVLFSLYLDLTLTLFLQFQFPFWILAFCFLPFDYLLFLLVFSVFLSCVLRLVLFVIVFCPVLPFTQIPWPLTATTWKQLSTLTSQVSGSVSPYLAARLLRSTSWSLLSCLSLPLELPSPCSSPLLPRTGSVVIPLAHIMLSALPLCLDWFTIHSPCCFQSMSCK